MTPIAFKLKQSLYVSLLSMTAIAVSLPALAVRVEQVPNPRQVYGGWVTDMAGILSDSTEKQLNQIISQLEATNGSEIAVVTVPETKPSATPKQFATSLFNYWGIGKAGKNNGVLVLISHNERRIEIETGSGIQTILPNSKVSNIIEQQIKPQFKQGNFDGGTLAGTQALVVVLQKNTPLSVSVPISSTATPNIAYSNPTVYETAKNSDILGLIGWLTGISGCGVLGAIAYRKLQRPTYVQAQGRSRTNSWFKKPLHCINCQKPMKKLDSSSVKPYLSKEEQVAKKIGSLTFEAWQCANCYSTVNELPFHIRAYENNTGEFSTCHNCEELTVTRHQKILQSATQYSEGIKLITYQCHCCDYSYEQEKIIPRLPTYENNNHNNDYNSNSYSSNSNSYSSDSSSSSFGGGSSDGGGAGGSW
ncbi:MAG TPA: TPM domain-containing protein [Leptolyngbyaceae cyanobacterium]